MLSPYNLSIELPIKGYKNFTQTNNLKILNTKLHTPILPITR